MTTFAEERAASANADDEKITGFPGVPTWRGVYLCVLGIFAGLMVLMTVFSRYYS